MGRRIKFWARLSRIIDPQTKSPPVRAPPLERASSDPTPWRSYRCLFEPDWKLCGVQVAASYRRGRVELSASERSSESSSRLPKRLQKDGGEMKVGKGAVGS